MKVIGPNESAYIPLELNIDYQIQRNYMTLIEIQSGSYLGEDDIKRFEDNYGR